MAERLDFWGGVPVWRRKFSLRFGILFLAGMRRFSHRHDFRSGTNWRVFFQHAAFAREKKNYGELFCPGQTFDACNDRGSAFLLKWFLNDDAP